MSRYQVIVMRAVVYMAIALVSTNSTVNVMLLLLIVLNVIDYRNLQNENNK